MDSHNLFFTRTTAYWLRAEYALALAVCVVLAVLHLGEIRWLPFIALFAVIDLVGYIPGAIAFRRSVDGRIPLVYYRLYNVMHSHLTAAAIAGVWWLVAGPEWALLALPIHQLGDRSIFGNFQTNTTLLLGNGQTRQFNAATDRITGEIVRVDVTLRVLK